MAGFWDAYKGDRFKFVTPGDKIEGVVESMSATDFGDGPVPVLRIKVAGGEVKELTCSQTVLVRRLAEACPEVGDSIFIGYEGEDTKNARPGRSPAKLFTVLVERQKAEVAASPPDPDQQSAGFSEDPF